MENIYEYGALINKIDWRNKSKLHVVDFSTRKNGMLTKSEFKVNSIDLAMYLDIEHNMLMDKLENLNVCELQKATYKHYAPGVLDPKNFDEKYEFYWIDYPKIDKVLVALGGK